MAPRTLADQRIIEIMYLLIMIGDVRSQAHFCNIIGAHKSIITKIQRGEMSFTLTQVENVCREFGINSNFIFGVERNIYRGAQNTLAIDKILKSLRVTSEPKVRQKGAV